MQIEAIATAYRYAEATARRVEGVAGGAAVAAQR
jgi:hypothetical protein